jgi:methionyl-tRNA formyltransferase
MRILFAGTPALAVPSLREAARACEVAAVLTSPDQPSGRGRAPTPSPVKEMALALGLSVLTPDRLDSNVLDQVRRFAPRLLVVAAYGKIFRKAFLELFPLGGINLHPSLLPRHRGPSPISAAVLAGDPVTGVTVQRIALRFDTGDILAQERHELRGDETTASLTETLADEGARLLGSVLSCLAAGGDVPGTAQEEAAATYCRLIGKEDGVVDWGKPAQVIERAIRAYDPWPRASTTLDGQILLLLKSHVYPGTLATDAAVDAPGAVLAADKAHGLLVRTGDGVLAIERLQLQFKKPLDWRAFLNGHPGIVGKRLGGEKEEI